MLKKAGIQWLHLSEEILKCCSYFIYLTSRKALVMQEHRLLLLRFLNKIFFGTVLIRDVKFLLCRCARFAYTYVESKKRHKKQHMDTHH